MAVDPLTGQTIASPQEQLAQGLIGQAFRPEPVGTPMEGLGRLAQTLVGFKLQRDQQRAQQEQAQSQLEGLRSALVGPQGQGGEQTPQNRFLAAALSSPEMFRTLGPAAIQSAFKGQEKPTVGSQFGAITDQGERITVLRTDRGLATQDAQGNLVPVDSRTIRPVSTQEQGTSSELGLTKKDVERVKSAQESTENFISTVGDAITLLNESPDANTFAGRAASVVNNLQAEARSLAKNLDLGFDESIFDTETHDQTFDKLGIDNQRMRSLVTALAFQAAAASGQTGRSVSNRDIQRFIEEIGASSADPRAFAQTLRDVAGRTARNFETIFRVRTGDPFEGSVGVEGLPEFSPGNNQQQPNQASGPQFDEETQNLINELLRGQ